MPKDKLSSYNLDEKTLAEITHQIEKNLVGLTREKDVSYAMESAEFKKQFTMRIIQAESSITRIEQNLIPRLQ